MLLINTFVDRHRSSLFLSTIYIKSFSVAKTINSYHEGKSKSDYDICSGFVKDVNAQRRIVSVRSRVRLLHEAGLALSRL